MAGKSASKESGRDESLEVKVREFADRMTASGARNLYPMIIRAVEKPLITHILKVVKWNQVHAASVLGLNRNTLRKKIRDLHIQRPKSLDQDHRN